ncbi:hypothetical protein [Tahibacter sp.]|uniref:hypothetical protein n=1 Tax=Tahibacter sp. TaxID=2056211 RepID=UPI0028C4DB6A|nr:hypothetical protein [Tahibacter sp.]
MKSTATHGGLRRLLFAGGLALTGAAAVLSPDWSSVLKAQGYYSNVDLGIVLDAPGIVEPGQEFELAVLVHNQGPGIAHRVRTVAAAQQLSYVGGIGCDGPRYPQCALADSLGIGVFGYQLTMRVPDYARNHVQFSASVASDDIEAQPGDEIALIKIPVYVPLDLRTDIACARVADAARGTVRCSIRFSSVVSHGARLPLLRASVNAAQSPQWSCEATQPTLCATAVASGNSYEATPTVLPGGSSVTFFADLRVSRALPVVALDAEARLNPAMGETDIAPGNNRSHLDYEPSLFAHDFEPAG